MLETVCELIEQTLWRQHTAFEKFMQQQLGLFSHRVATVAEPIDHMWKDGRRVCGKVLAQPADQFGKRLESSLCNLWVCTLKTCVSKIYWC